MRNYAALKERGWNVLIIWECEVNEILRSKSIPSLPALPSQAYPSSEKTTEATPLTAAERI